MLLLLQARSVKRTIGGGLSKDGKRIVKGIGWQQVAATYGAAPVVSAAPTDGAAPVDGAPPMDGAPLGGAEIFCSIR